MDGDVGGVGRAGRFFDHVNNVTDVVVEVGLHRLEVGQHLGPQQSVVLAARHVEHRRHLHRIETGRVGEDRGVTGSAFWGWFKATRVQQTSDAANLEDGVNVALGADENGGEHIEQGKKLAIVDHVGLAVVHRHRHRLLGNLRGDWEQKKKKKKKKKNSRCRTR